MKRNYAEDAPYMKLAQYSRSRGVSYGSLRQLIAAGKLPAGKAGRNWIVDVKRCDDFFRDLTTPREEKRPAEFYGSGRRFDFMASIDAKLKEAKRLVREGLV